MITIILLVIVGIVWYICFAPIWSMKNANKVRKFFGLTLHGEIK